MQPFPSALFPLRALTHTCPVPGFTRLSSPFLCGLVQLSIANSQLPLPLLPVSVSLGGDCLSNVVYNACFFDLPSTQFTTVPTPFVSLQHHLHLLIPSH